MDDRSYNFATDLRDVSTTGACIVSVGRLRRSVRMTVDICFPDQLGWIRSKATVRWSKEVDGGYETGLQFLGLPNVFGDAVKRWFDTRC